MLHKLFMIDDIHSGGYLRSVPYWISDDEMIYELVRKEYLGFPTKHLSLDMAEGDKHHWGL